MKLKIMQRRKPRPRDRPLTDRELMAGLACVFLIFVAMAAVYI